MRLSGFYLLGFIFLLSRPAFLSAEYYQYKDKEGRILFTDDISKLSDKERSDLLRFESIVSDKEEEEKTSKDKEHKNDNLRQNSVEDKKILDLSLEKKALESEKNALSEEFSRLQILQKKLSDRAASFSRIDAKTAAAHNKEIQEFEAALNAYEKRQVEHNERIKAFNKRVEEGE